MSKDKLLPISIFCLAISIIIAASVISNGIETKGRYISDGIFQGANNINTTIRDIFINNEDEKTVLDKNEASEYLGVSIEGLMQIMNNEESKIPYIKVGEYFIFSKNAIDKWVEESNFKM